MSIDMYLIVIFQFDIVKEKEGDIVSQQEICNVASNWCNGQYLEVKESSYPM